MTSTDPRSWPDILTQFCALGGTAENIRMGYGSLGRGLFAIDPSKPVDLRTPPNLLPRRSDVIFRDNRFYIAPAANIGEPERAWLERYLNEISWGSGGRDETTAEIERLRSLPLAVRETLARTFGMKFVVGELSPEMIAQRFLDARVITVNEETVMPMIELVNNGPAPGYDTSSGVAVRGLFSDEVLVSYSEGHDTILCFAAWGIVCERPFAYSHPLRLPIRQMDLDILVDIHDAKKVEVNLPKTLPLKLPKVTVQSGRIGFSFLMLGMKGLPRIPKSMFRRVIGDAGLQLDDEPFEIAQYINRGTFLGLLRDLETVEGEAARSLRRVCLLQLDALNQSFGSRPL